MHAEAFIESNSRTVMGFIFKPLSDSIRRAFREQWARVTRSTKIVLRQAPRRGASSISKNAV
jgi:hypothetical protein